MRKALLAVSASLALSMSFSVMAGGNIAAGKAKAEAVCSACHGLNGISVAPMYPNLRGQKETYIINALHAYKSNQRNGGMAPIMQAQAAALSDADIANAAAYYSSLK